jgi:putative flippase GtrA
MIDFKNKKEITRFLRFAFVGLVGAVIDFGIFNLLSSVMRVNASIAQAISFSCAVASNFVWNRYWTYPDSRSKPISSQLGQFLVVSVIGLAIRTPLFGFLEKVLTDVFTRMLPAGSSFSPVFLAHNLSLAIAIVVVMMWNFIANRLWTYNDVDKPSEPAASNHEQSF